MNQTLQSRLPVEFRRANITTIEQANEFLKSYLKKFNAQFALQLNNTKTIYKQQQPSEEDINRILAIVSEQTLENGHCVRYKKNYYIPVDSNSERIYLAPKTKCLMIESFDKKTIHDSRRTSVIRRKNRTA